MMAAIGRACELITKAARKELAPRKRQRTSTFVEPGSDGAKEAKSTDHLTEVCNRDQAYSSGLQKKLKKTNARISYSDSDERGSNSRNGREGDYQLASEERFVTEGTTCDFDDEEEIDSEYERDGRRPARERYEE
ncbi:hypothetical protein QAD02_018278 [Eretmocerus hayati]|uniref:Uncharacterized protein n=1 Tax=Eretmocerus hayati TaxID=131215 RepID=A0ACC2PHI1_9HYME|nr:hypothetical protein QAD02_018278 [Eretmocerus hayati]